MTSLKKYVFLLFISISLSSCSIIKVMNLMNKGEVAMKTFYEQVPIEFENRMVTLPVSMGGITYQFILDTGAPTVLSEEIADTLNLKPATKVKSADAHKNESTMEFTEVGDINIGGLKFINQGAAIYDFKQNRELDCFSFTGILGANLMKDAIWQINIQEKIIHITNDVKKIKIADDALKFKFRQQLTGTPLADINVCGTEIKNVIIDYGSGSGIDLVSDKMIQKIKDEKIKHSRVYGYNSMGLYGGNSDTSFIFESDVLLSENPIGRQKISLRSKGLSTIGTQILKNYIVTFDWSERTVYFEKIASDTDDFLKTFGFTALLSEGKFLVTSLTENSSAAENGLALGDQITAVDDKDYTKFSDEDYCDYIINGMVPPDVNEVEITFMHNNEIKNVRLERRKNTN